MAQEGKPPESGAPTDAPADAAPQTDARANSSSPISADAEKDAQVEAAKARVIAAKEAAQKAAPAAPGAPKPPVKKKEEGPKPSDASNHPLVKRLREKCADAVTEVVTQDRHVSTVASHTSLTFEVELPQTGTITGVVLADHVKNLDWEARRVVFGAKAPSEVLTEVRERLRALLEL